MSSVNNGIPFVPENTVDPAAGLNLSINTIDAILQVRVETLGEAAPPASPTNGERHVVGASPSGAWAGQANKLARFLDGGWDFYDAAIVVNLADDKLYIRVSSGDWVAVN